MPHHLHASAGPPPLQVPPASLPAVRAPQQPVRQQPPWLLTELLLHPLRCVSWPAEHSVGSGLLYALTAGLTACKGSVASCIMHISIKIIKAGFGNMLGAKRAEAQATPRRAPRASVRDRCTVLRAIPLLLPQPGWCVPPVLWPAAALMPPPSPAASPQLLPRCFPAGASSEHAL